MMELASRWPAVLVLASMAGMACAQSDTPWSGGYAGLNLGEASTSACNTWTAGGTAVNPAGGPAFYSSNCASSSFVGGVQVGDNFQYKRLVWGIEADLDLWEGGNRSQMKQLLALRRRPGVDQRADVRAARGDDAVKRRVDLFERLQFLEALQIRLGGRDHGFLGFEIALVLHH